jgi:membrane protein
MSNTVNTAHNALNHIWASSTRVVRAALKDNLLHVAASLAFTTILALVPLLTVTLSLMTAFPIFSDFESALQQFLRQQFLPEAFSETVMSYLDEFVSKATSLSTIGGVFLLITSLLVIMSIDDSLNDIWHVRKQRPLGQRLLIYWAVLTLGPIVLGASLWASSSVVQQALSLQEPGAVVPWQAFAAWLPFVISWAGCSLLFLTVPNCKVGYAAALTGGFVSSLLFQVIKFGLSLYLANIPTYTVIYGAFSVLPTFLVWIYLSWLAFLSGAVVAANMPRQIAPNRVDVHAHHDNLATDP